MTKSEVLRHSGEYSNPMRRVAIMVASGAIALGITGSAPDLQEAAAVPLAAEGEVPSDSQPEETLDCDYDEMLKAYNPPPGASETIIDEEKSLCDGSTAVLRFGNNMHTSNVYIFEARNERWRAVWNNSGAGGPDCSDMSPEMVIATPECSYEY